MLYHLDSKTKGMYIPTGCHLNRITGYIILQQNWLILKLFSNAIKLQKLQPKWDGKITNSEYVRSWTEAAMVTGDKGKPWKTSITTAGNPAGIWTWYLLHTSLEHYYGTTCLAHYSKELKKLHEGCGRKKQWPILIHYPWIFLKDLR